MSLCKTANVKQLAIFHHDPDHTDDIMDKIGEESKEEWDQSFVTREGSNRLDDCRARPPTTSQFPAS